MPEKVLPGRCDNLASHGSDDTPGNCHTALLQRTLAPLIFWQPVMGGLKGSAPFGGNVEGKHGAS